MSENQLAFVFPGQGSQKVGMLSDFIERYEAAKNLFLQASDILGYNLLTLIQEGPEDQLNQTVYTQPALLTAGMAVWKVWCKEGGKQPDLLAGHSLGEYTALAASEIIDFVDAVSLVAKRGELMQAAFEQGSGAMAAVLALSDERVTEICRQASEKGVVAPANFNAPGQVVIAGESVAVDYAIQLAKQAKARKAIKLAVSVPSHCSLMQPASEQMAIALERITFNQPKIPVINNVHATIESDPERIKQALVEQLVNPVQWVKTIQKVVSETDEVTIAECGPGKVLTAMNKRIDSSAKFYALSVESDFNNLLEEK